MYGRGDADFSEDIQLGSWWNYGTGVDGGIFDDDSLSRERFRFSFYCLRSPELPPPRYNPSIAFFSSPFCTNSLYLMIRVFCMFAYTVVRALQTNSSAALTKIMSPFFHLFLFFLWVLFDMLRVLWSFFLPKPHHQSHLVAHPCTAQPRSPSHIIHRAHHWMHRPNLFGMPPMWYRPRPFQLHVESPSNLTRHQDDCPYRVVWGTEKRGGSSCTLFRRRVCLILWEMFCTAWEIIKDR